ncbi:MAG TPA: MMPL family transporter [Gemmataceae bacterium]|nr:MMPL family transporter [Gemmataceae bacterium]
MKAEQDPSHGASHVPRLLTTLVETVHRFPRLVLAVALLVCAASAYAACTRLEYRTQRSDLVSPRKDYQQRWSRYLAEFGDDNDIVVVVKGSGRGRMRRALEALAAEVRKRPDRFDRLFYKVDLRPLHDRALLFLPADQIGQIQNNLRSMSMLLEPPLVAGLDALIGWKSLTLSRLLHEARDRAGKINPDRPLGSADDQFLTQLLAITGSAAAIFRNPADYRNPWHSLLAQPPQQKDLMAEPQYFFSGDGTLAFLLARPIKEESCFTADQKSVEAMRTIVASVAPSFPGVELGLTGLPVLENDEMVASQRDTGIASWLALAGVGLLYLVVFRGLRYPLLTVVTLLVGTAWALGWLTLTVGHLNILSSTFVVMLIGMGDYGVLWVTRYEQNRAAGADVRTALRNTAAGGGPSILTAATATALAFFAAMLADFQAVAELGWIAGSGVLLCAFACFTVMPALLTLTDRRDLSAPVSISIRGWSAWLPALASRPRWVLGASAALTVVLAVCACSVGYDHNLLHLQAQGLDSVKWEMTLIEHTAGASWHAQSYVSTREDALALKARYEQLPGVSRVVEVAALVPLDQDRKLEQLADIQRRLRRLPGRGVVIPHALPSIRALKTEIDCLVGSLQPLADASGQPLLVDLRHSLVALRDELANVPTSVNAERLRAFEQRLTGDLAEDLHRLRDVSLARPITLADLPAGLRTRYVGRTGKWLVHVFAKDCLWDIGPLRQFVDTIRTVDPEATGKPFATLEGLQALKSGFEWAGLYALGAILLVFYLDFRSWRHTLWAFAPLAMGVIISLGIMGLSGLTLNPATMIAFPLILGVGAVYGVHVVHDYLAQRAVRHYTLSYLIGRAILVMALANIISFGTLAISRHRGLSGLGLIIALGISCCMLTALVFLPALLRLLSSRTAAAPAETQEERTRRLAA